MGKLTRLRSGNEESRNDGKHRKYLAAGDEERVPRFIFYRSGAGLVIRELLTNLKPFH